MLFTTTDTIDCFVTSMAFRFGGTPAAAPLLPAAADFPFPGHRQLQIQRKLLEGFPLVARQLQLRPRAGSLLVVEQHREV
jgi:hypothetical protein